MNETTNVDLSDLISYACNPPGKRLRSRFLCAFANAYGYQGSQRQLKMVAEALEFGHTASLVHDDIIDRDLIRRGKPSVFGRFGKERALLVGDALIFQMFEQLSAALPSDCAEKVINLVANMGIGLCVGQLLEGHKVAEGDRVGHYFEVARYKTAEYFVTACQAGAMLAGVSDDQLTIVKAFGYRFGLAFQIRDDLLPVLAAGESSGKPLDSDERNSRTTALSLFNSGIDICTEYQRYVSSLLGEGCGSVIGVGGRITDPSVVVSALSAHVNQSLAENSGLEAEQLTGIFRLVQEGLCCE